MDWQGRYVMPHQSYLNGRLAKDPCTEAQGKVAVTWPPLYGYDRELMLIWSQSLSHQLSCDCHSAQEWHNRLPQSYRVQATFFWGEVPCSITIWVLQISCYDHAVSCFWIQSLDSQISREIYPKKLPHTHKIHMDDSQSLEIDMAKAGRMQEMTRCIPGSKRLAQLTPYSCCYTRITIQILYIYIYISCMYVWYIVDYMCMHTIIYV